MERIPIEVAEMLERRLPDFVDEVHGHTSDSAKLKIEDFAGDPTLFYKCVRYALSCGKSVFIEPTEQPKERH